MKSDVIPQVIYRLILPLSLVVVTFLATQAFASYDKRHVTLESQKLNAQAETRESSTRLTQQRLAAVRTQTPVGDQVSETFRRLQDGITGKCSHGEKFYFRCVDQQIKILALVSKNH